MDLEVVRRLVRDQWVRSHGTPRVSVIAGEIAAARRIWEMWLSSSRMAEQPACFEAPQPILLDRILAQAIGIATTAPGQPVAVLAAISTIETWRQGRCDRLAAMVDEGLVIMTSDRAPQAKLSLLDARSLAELTLFEALQATAATAGRFELNADLAVMFGDRAAEVDLLSRSDRVAIEIDGYYHFDDADDYRRDRRKDLLLQGQGLLVVRILADDVLRDTRGAVNTVIAAMALRLAMERR